MGRKNLTQYVSLRLERRRMWDSIAGARIVGTPMDVGSRWQELTARQGLRQTAFDLRVNELVIAEVRRNLKVPWRNK